MCSLPVCGRVADVHSSVTQRVDESKLLDCFSDVAELVAQLSRIAERTREWTSIIDQHAREGLSSMEREPVGVH